jgi:PQQ-dependent catabolism-associated CXXCW motif protein
MPGPPSVRGLGLLAAVLLAGGALAATPEPQGYRGEPYRAPTPATLAGAVAIDADAALALAATGRVAFVDVLPRAPKPANLPEGTIWRDPPHASLPGAIWLPDVGYQELAPETLDYLLAGLAAATGGDPDAPLVVFCKRDCWMSWNAAKRVLEHGYARVFWFPDGTDGWSEAGGALEPATPFIP